MAQQYKTKSKRLKYWDYSTPWWYFVTISTQNHKNYFGDVIHGNMQLNEIGNIAQYEWIKTAELRENVELDEFIIMPNHMHGILIISESRSVETRRGVSDVGETKILSEDTLLPQKTPRDVSSKDGRDVLEGAMPFKKTRHGVSPQSQIREFSKPIKDSLSTIINLYKGSVTKECNIQKYSFKWQPKFYDRIIRNDRELYNIRRYIMQNPLKWELEKETPDNF